MTSPASHFNFNPKEPYFSQSLIKKTALPQNKYVPTNFKELDTVIKGFRNSNLTILGGRPGMGCRSLALTMACRQAWAEHKVACFFMSLTESELIERVKRNYRCYNQSHTAPFPSFHVDYLLDVDKLHHEIGLLKREENIEVVFVDSVQMLGVKDDSASDKTAIAVRSLWEMSREFDISVVALSALSREPEFRVGDKRPFMYNLRASSTLEMYADVVLLLYRPAYYGMNEDLYGDSLVNVAEIRVVKNSNGHTADVKLGYDHTSSMFVDDKDILPF
ncbi:MAG: DnaB-like helicase C-terminal domain-containing protein [Bacteroidales bacterium]|nr:DnaB-like helicase C-terminal domain-containing protein [Bacteroidales bacterium]